MLRSRSHYLQSDCLQFAMNAHRGEFTVARIASAGTASSISILTRIRKPYVYKSQSI